MPKLDIIHGAVKSALIKDGWTITDDPYIIEYKKTKLYMLTLLLKEQLLLSVPSKRSLLKLRASSELQNFKI
jgi:hypothetical protein